MIGPFLCFYCSRVDLGDGTGKITCTAFPGGIPWALVATNFDHRQEWPGDNGVRFEKKNGVDDSVIHIIFETTTTEVNDDIHPIDGVSDSRRYV